MERDAYEVKYELLRKKYHRIQLQNEKLQNRIHNIRQQVHFMRSLKRILIQKLLVYGDRFMEVCLEIPDMEPGANVEDKIINVVAEAPKKPPVTSTSASTPAAASVNQKRKRNTTTFDSSNSQQQQQPSHSQQRRASTGVKVLAKDTKQQMPAGITVKVKAITDTSSASNKSSTMLPTTVVLSGAPTMAVPKKRKRYPAVLKKPTTASGFGGSPKNVINTSGIEFPIYNVFDSLKSAANLEEIVNSVIHESQHQQQHQGSASVSADVAFASLEAEPPSQATQAVPTVSTIDISSD